MDNAFRGLKLEPTQCEYLRPEFEYLGHLITAETKPSKNKSRKRIQETN